MLLWDQSDYLMEAEKQLSDKKELNFNEKLKQDLTETSNKIIRSLKSIGFIADKELKYFRFDQKRECNLRKLSFLPNIHQRNLNVPG